MFAESHVGALSLRYHVYDYNSLAKHLRMTCNMRASDTPTFVNAKIEPAEKF